VFTFVAKLNRKNCCKYWLSCCRDFTVSQGLE